MNDVLQTEFAAKTWIYKALALIFGGLGIFGLIMGPLFLFQIMLNARGKPATDAGVALTISSIPFLALFAYSTFSILARRRPTIRLFKEGLVAREIGAPLPNLFEYLPALLRVAFHVISFRAFKQRTLVLPWESFAGATILETTFDRWLILEGKVYGLTRGENPRAMELANQKAYPEVEFRMPLQQIAATINCYHQDLTLREKLESWSET
jgi:hypothetical protein